MRLQSRGYVHSTSIEGDATYRNVTVELLSLRHEPDQRRPRRDGPAARLRPGPHPYRPGPGGKPDVHVYNSSLTELDHFFAYDALFLGGAFVAGNQ